MARITINGEEFEGDVEIVRDEDGNETGCVFDNLTPKPLSTEIKPVSVELTGKLTPGGYEFLARHYYGEFNC